MTSSFGSSWTRTARLTTLALGCAVLASGAFLAARALAVSAYCDVTASFGFANCLIVSGPSNETVQALQTSGVPYKMELWRSSDGAIWGPWTISSTNSTGVALNLSGTITEQVDNLGTGSPSRYLVAMS